MRRAIRLLDRALTRGSGGFAGLLLAAITAVVSWQVAARQLLGFSPRWTEEIALLLMVWLAMVGAALGLRLGEHVGIEFLVQALSPRLRWWVLKGVELAVFGFSLFITLEGWDLTVASAAQTLPATKLPMAFLYAGIPVGGLVMSGFAFGQLLGVVPQGGER